MILKEIDMYDCIKDFFEAEGYNVKAEVKDCDIVCKKEDSLVIVELKLKFSLKLIYQAMDRQALTTEVYIAVLKPKRAFYGKEWHRMLKLVKSLCLGLILVDNNKNIEFVCHPSADYTRKLNSKKKIVLNKEFDNRKTSINKGGTRGKTMTVYKEKSLLIIDYIKNSELYAPKDINSALSIKNASVILNQNHYGWYEKIAKGSYKISEKGLTALVEYSEVIDMIKLSEL